MTLGSGCDLVDTKSYRFHPSNLLKLPDILHSDPCCMSSFLANAVAEILASFYFSMLGSFAPFSVFQEQAIFVVVIFK